MMLRMRTRRRAGALLLTVGVLLSGCSGTHDNAISTDSATSTSTAPALWSGNFQTGNFSQWAMVQEAWSGGATIVTSPARHGYPDTAKFTVRPGDHWDSSLTERAEVAASTSQTDASEGRDQFYAWSALFPTGTAIDEGGWLLFTDWHQTANTCPPPLAFYLTDAIVPHIEVATRGGVLNQSDCTWQYSNMFDLGTLPTGSWTDFMVHVKWSSNPAVGMLAVRINGHDVLRPVAVSNLFTGQAAYLKQGLYRSNMTRTSTVYMTGTVRGDTQTSVRLQ
jgi:Polysaccharide lyase